MILASDSHDLGWLALGIRPIPAFGHGFPCGWGVSKYSRIPNLVKFDYPLWRTGHPDGAAKRSHCANFRNKIIKNYHKMRMNYSSNSPVRTSILDY